MLKEFFRDFWMRKFEKKYAFYKYDDGKILHMVGLDDPEAKISFREGIKMLVENKLGLYDFISTEKEELYIQKKLKKRYSWTNY